jgi:hypothetical protein
MGENAASFQICEKYSTKHSSSSVRILLWHTRKTLIRMGRPSGGAAGLSSLHRTAEDIRFRRGDHSACAAAG